MRQKKWAMATLAWAVAAGPVAANTVNFGTAGGLQFKINFDQTVTAQSNWATIEAAFGTATQAISSYIASPLTLSIDVSWGQAGAAGAATKITSTGAAMSVNYPLAALSYAQTLSSLKFSALTSGNTLAQAALAALPKATVDSSRNFMFTVAEAKALGLVGSSYAGYGGYDGYIGFGGSSTGYFYTPAGKTGSTDDFVGIAEHEITEVMGRITGIGSGLPYLTPLDLFRYSSAGVNTVSTAKYNTAYFSLDGGRTALDYFNTTGYGDYSDWTPGSITNSFDYIGSPGTTRTLTGNDLMLLDAIGWNPSTASKALTGLNLTGSLTGSAAVSEPASLALLGFASAALLFGTGGARRRNAGSAAETPPDHGGLAIAESAMVTFATAP
jgi:hypothetical protein